MSRMPYFPFYPAEFMAGVRGLNAQETGIYIMLLCRMYEEAGPITNDIGVLSAYCQSRPSWVERALEKLTRLGKIKTDGAALWNDRAMREIDARAKKCENAARAGQKSAEKRQEKQEPSATTVQRPFNHTDTEKSTVAKATGGAAAVTDFNDAIWTNGVQYLVRHGMPEKGARSLLGKLKSSHGDEAVYAALAAANRAGSPDPAAYIVAALKPKPAAADQKLSSWGIGDAQPVRLEPGAGDITAVSTTRAPDLPRVQRSPEGAKPESAVLVSDNYGGWTGDFLPPLRAFGGVVS